jgi:hypothetical protein
LSVEDLNQHQVLLDGPLDEREVLFYYFEATKQKQSNLIYSRFIHTAMSDKQSSPVAT